MKKLLLLGLIYSFSGYGQDFAPFNDESPKRFHLSSDPTDNEFYFYATNSTYSGDTVIYSQYFLPSSEDTLYDSFVCASWGWGGEAKIPDTTFLSDELIYDNASKKLWIDNKLSLSLTFDFGMVLGDSSMLYSDDFSEYYLKYSSAANESILGFTDSIKRFNILHYDLSGAPIYSELHGFQIKLGKTLGVIDFIDCYNFPAVERGFYLVGQQKPNIGHYQMSYDQAFPWQVGDELQYKGLHQNTNWGVFNKQYKLLTITDRVETSDSVFIYYSVETINEYNPEPPMEYPYFFNVNYSNPIKFAKGEVISSFPYNGISILYEPITGDSVEFCGEMKAGVQIRGEFTEYCDSCKCRVSIDGFSTTRKNQYFAEGVGIYSWSVLNYGVGSSFDSQSASLIYYNIDGIECGQKAFASQDNFKKTLTIFPNPAQSTVFISDFPVGATFSVLGMNGSEFQLNYHFTKGGIRIDVSSLSTGFYLLKIYDNDIIYTEKLIIE